MLSQVCQCKGVRLKKRHMHLRAGVHSESTSSSGEGKLCVGLQKTSPEELLLPFLGAGGWMTDLPVVSSYTYCCKSLMPAFEGARLQAVLLFVFAPPPQAMTDTTTSTSM